MFNRYSEDWKVNYFCYSNQCGGWQSYSRMMNTIHELIAKVGTLDTRRKHQERAPPSSMITGQIYLLKADPDNA
jgi:hypothetical protein